MGLKIEDIKIGTKLELVEEELRKATKPFVLGWLDYMRSQEEIIVTGLDGDMLEVNISDDWGISDESIKYFKKKDQYTFDDLIDVSTKAFKDRTIFSVGITICAVSIKLHDKSEEVFTIMDIDEGIEFIQSLYKESFVIETEEDLDRFNKDVEITLANDEKLSWEDLKSIGLMNTHAIFKALKGATVTQSK